MDHIYVPCTILAINIITIILISDFCLWWKYGVITVQTGAVFSNFIYINILAVSIATFQVGKLP